MWSNYFVWDSDSGITKLRLWTQTLALKTGLLAQIHTPTLTPECVLDDDLRKILNSSNKRYAIVYKQNFRSARTIHQPKPHRTELNVSLRRKTGLKPGLWRTLRLHSTGLWIARH